MQQVMPGGFLLLNGVAPFHRDTLKSYTVGTISALEISKNSGLAAIVNTAILGAYIRLANIVNVDTLLKAIKVHVPAAPDKNIAAAKEAYEKLCVV